MALDDAGVLELAVELVVELGPVGDHHERPVARLAAQDLLREEQHREALAGALRVPEDAEPALARALVAQRAHRRVDPEYLVVLREHLDQSAGALEVGDEVLDHVEQPRRLAQPADRGLQRDDAWLLLVGDASSTRRSAPTARTSSRPSSPNRWRGSRAPLGVNSCGIVSR